MTPKDLAKAEELAREIIASMEADRRNCGDLVVSREKVS